MATIVVVGSGAAGLTVALEASPRHDVILLTKGELGDSNSRCAQGGIAAATGLNDSPDLHLADTIVAGAGLVDERAARILCEEGPGRIRDLLELGMPFDREGHDIARAREAAHSVARVLHGGGDATGRALIETLADAVRASTVTVRENVFVADLLLAGGTVVGVETIRNGSIERMPADAVVVASGGAGQLFEHTTNPAGATGDGVAAAARAGAHLADLEFYQFHPTALAVEGTPLVSEAVRGAGAVLLDAYGRRVMLDEHPDAELAPRDVVARAIARTMAGQGGLPVLLDARTVTALPARFPAFAALCAHHGLDPVREPVPVTPAAHYWMGGIVVDDRGRTSIPGLSAVGEAARTGVHGANRLASNSLLEALVFGHRVAEDLEGLSPQSPRLEGCAPQARELGSVPVDRAELQRLMWSAVGLERDAAGLSSAAQTIALWRVSHSTIADRETANLRDLARLLVEAASARHESVGAHYRADSTEVSSTAPRKVALSC